MFRLKHVELGFVHAPRGNHPDSAIFGRMDASGARPLLGHSAVPLPPRHDGLLQLLFQTPTYGQATADPSRHLVRLLKKPPRNSYDPAMVAVPQGRSGLGDLHIPVVTRRGDRAATSPSRERFLPDAGLKEREEKRGAKLRHVEFVRPDGNAFTKGAVTKGDLRGGSPRVTNIRTRSRTITSGD